MRLLNYIHENLIFKRRVRVLSNSIAKLIPENSTILDIGCGDGLIDSQIIEQRPDIKITGLDVLVRDKTFIEVIKFDGKSIPFQDNQFDCAMFIDVLHHTTDPIILLKEGKRIAKDFIIIKDHLRDGFFSGGTLKLMDWVGNARHNVVLPYNYWQSKQWENAFSQLNLKPIAFIKNLIYTLP
jgi:SAM-dependent methyltransferase